MPELFKSIDKNLIKKPIGYCKTHKGYLSLKQMRLHKCMKKGCTGFKKVEGPYWEERQRRKDEAKQRKKQNKEDGSCIF